MFARLHSNTKGFLKFFSQKTGLDGIYLARGGFWSSFSFVVNSSIALVSVIAFANLLPADVYGQYKYILSLGGIFAVFSLTGMNTAVTQAVAQGHDNTYRYAVRYQIYWNMLVVIASTLVAVYYVFEHNWLLAIGVFIIGVTFPFTAAYNTFGSYLLAKREFGRLTLYTSISSFLNVAPLVTVLFVTHNVLALVATYAVAGLLPNIFFHFYVLHLFKPSKARLKTEEKASIKYGAHLSILTSFSNIAANIDKVILFHYLGAIQVAIYSLATSIPNRIGGYMKTVGVTILPKLANRSLTEISGVFYKRVLQTLLLGLAISLSYVLAAPFIFKYLLTKYLASVNYSRVLSIAFIFQATGNYVGNVFRAHKIISAAYVASVQTLLRIALYIIMGVYWGIWGIVWATVSMQIVGFFVSLLIWEYEKRRL